VSDKKTRNEVVERALADYDDGLYMEELRRRVAIPTESQNPKRLPELYFYLNDEIGPAFADLGYQWRVFDNPFAGHGPVLLTERIEDPDLPTVLGYGHGDVIRGYEEQWREGLGPWDIVQEGDRFYGRGTADNKAQHTVHMRALKCVLEVRGRLGFNSRFLVETGEETGSRGLEEIVRDNCDAFAADALIASDGPRVSVERASITLGNRGAMNFDLVCELREGGHHSGNWGGLLANPGIILAHAIAGITTATGRIRISEWLPEPIPNSVRHALRDVGCESDPGAPEMDLDWGEPNLTQPEKVYAWNTFEVLAFRTGNPDNPVNAIPPKATAHCQIRFVVGSDAEAFLPALRRHLDAGGFGQVSIQPPPAGNAAGFKAARTDLDHPWARWVAASIERTTGEKTVVLPNAGGSICNYIFQDHLGLPTIWIPHSYSGCCQHAPNEHILGSITREALAITAALYWDLGESPPLSRR
jgi:acetylornithine deacetylase/succinyl-diaminopimelate desuccinylase-like protein